RESYDRCKVLFCHILMELEMLNWRNSPEESLWDLRNRDEGTHISTAPSEGQAGIPLPEKFEDILHSSAPGTFEHDDHGLPEVSLPDGDEERTGSWVPGGSDADVPGWQNESTDLSWQQSEEGSPEGSELWTGLEVGEDAPGSDYEAQDRI